jgi:hypothetical protein
VTAGARRMERLPFAPLEHVLAGITINREPCLHNPGALAKVAGVTARQIYRWRTDGMTVLAADRVCCRINRHPAEIWDTWAPTDLRALAS